MSGRVKNILCYGDSNTWGYVPGSVDFTTYYVKRYDRQTRWTGRLQQDLMDSCYIIEEGLNGRTTNVDYKDIPGRNGKTYLQPCLYSHAPLDLVILWLGCNDFKIEFNRAAVEVADALDGLIRMIQSSSYGPDMLSAPEVLLIGYPEIVNQKYVGPLEEKIFDGAIAKSKEYLVLSQELAKKRGCHYVDMAAHVQLSDIDGIHLDPAGHAAVAALLSTELSRILG